MALSDVLTFLPPRGLHHGSQNAFLTDLVAKASRLEVGLPTVNVQLRELPSSLPGVSS